jgi:hypothetical protein
VGGGSQKQMGEPTYTAHRADSFMKVSGLLYENSICSLVSRAARYFLYAWFRFFSLVCSGGEPHKCFWLPPPAPRRLVSNTVGQTSNEFDSWNSM